MRVLVTITQSCWVDLAAVASENPGSKWTKDSMEEWLGEDCHQAIAVMTIKDDRGRNAEKQALEFLREKSC